MADLHFQIQNEIANEILANFVISRPSRNYERWNKGDVINHFFKKLAKRNIYPDYTEKKFEQPDLF